MIGDALQRGFGIGQGQKIVQKMAVVGGPGQMFGKARWLQPADQVLQPRQMIGIERPFAAN